MAFEAVKLSIFLIILFQFVTVKCVRKREEQTHDHDDGPAKKIRISDSDEEQVGRATDALDLSVSALIALERSETDVPSVIIDAYLDLLTREEPSMFAFIPTEVVRKQIVNSNDKESTEWLESVLAAEESLNLVRVWFVAVRLKRQNWALVVLDVEHQNLLFYDPFDPYHPRTDEKMALEKALKRLLFERIYPSSVGRLQWENQLYGPRHRSAHDSGIAVLMIAYTIVDQMSVEAVFVQKANNNLAEWRKKFARELRPRIEMGRSINHLVGIPKVDPSKLIHSIRPPPGSKRDQQSVTAWKWPRIKDVRAELSGIHLTALTRPSTDVPATVIDAYLELLSRQRHGEFAFVTTDVVRKVIEENAKESEWLKTTMASKANIKLVRVWFAAARLNQQYWTLAVLDVKNKMFLFFDPFDPHHPGTEEKIALEKALKNLFEHIYPSSVGHFQWQNQLFGPQYQSAHDSGIAVLMIAYAIVDQMSVEAKFAPNKSNNERNNELIQWREKFARELRPRIEMGKSYPAGMPPIPFDKQIHPILPPELPLIPWPPSISDLKRQKEEENTGIEVEAKEKKKEATKQIVRPDLTKWIGRKSDQVPPPPFVPPQLSSDPVTSSLIAPSEDYWTIVQKVIAELPKETQSEGEEHFEKPMEKDEKYPFLPASPSINWPHLASSKGDPSSPSVNSEAMFHRAIAELPPSPRSQKQKGKEADEKIGDEQHFNDSDIMLWDHPPPNFPTRHREPEMTAYDYQTTLIVDFLKTILDKNRWVENFVIDAYLELITRERPQQFGFVPSFVVTHYRESLKETVPSAERELLAPGWLERITEEHVRTASYWLVPAHLNNNHWALAIFDVQENVLTYLDSLNPGVDSPENRAFVRDILLLFNKLFEVKGDTRTGTFVLPRTKWVNRRRNVPRQWNTIDCGVFVLMFAREIVAENCVDAKLSGVISQALVPQYRQQIYEALEHRM